MKNTAIALFLLLPALIWGQVEQPPFLSAEKRKELESMKVAYLTSQMDLSPSEAQVFWPVYNQFRDEMDAHREEGRKKHIEYRLNKEDLTDAELLDHLSLKFDHERATIAIEEKHFKEFTEILSPRKVAAMIEAEEGFKRKLIERVRSERPERRR